MMADNFSLKVWCGCWQRSTPVPGPPCFWEKFPGELLLAGVVAVKGALGYLGRAGDILNSSGVTPFSTKSRKADLSISCLVLAAISMP